MKWIPCSERMPEDGQTVAFVAKQFGDIYPELDGRVLGGRYTAGKYGGFSVPGMMVDAYCWMPLPDAPTSGEGNHGD